ncbi:MAG: DUF1810 domain-containing protein [Alkalispirochaetaceae bacterium]
MSDSYGLERFVEAQEGVKEAVDRELAGGAKRSHWMWFVFPQIQGLGMSMMAQRYAINSLEEARAYLEHPVLGERLREWTRLVLNVQGKSAQEIFGYPDYLKFRSSMTLFSRVAEAGSVFHQALEKYYDGEPDQKTLSILGIG